MTCAADSGTTGLRARREAISSSMRAHSSRSCRARCRMEGSSRCERNRPTVCARVGVMPDLLRIGARLQLHDANALALCLNARCLLLRASTRDDGDIQECTPRIISTPCWSALRRCDAVDSTRHTPWPEAATFVSSATTRACSAFRAAVARASSSKARCRAADAAAELGPVRRPRRAAAAGCNPSIH